MHRFGPALLGLALSIALLSGTGTARASLTDSERAQLRGFVQEAQPASAPRVRALLARPDLSIAESTSALAEALTPIVFRDPHALYLRELMFTGASLSGRPVLVSTVARALLARADTLLAAHATDIDQIPQSLAELTRIYEFLDAQIANAGRPAGAAHDPHAGIPPATYDDCVHALSEHMQRNPRWLSPQAKVGLAFERVRAQEELALLDMMTDSPTLRLDAAAALGLAGARKRMLVELGVLVLDSGAADDARVEALRSFYMRITPPQGVLAPAPPLGVEALQFGPGAPRLQARGVVIGVGLPLEMPPSLDGPLARSDELATVPVDLPLFMLAYELSKPVAARALAEHPELRAWVADDVQANEAPPGAMSPDERAAGMMADLLVDAPRTVELAFGRAIGGKGRTAGLVSDALGILAAQAASAPAAAPPARGPGLSLALGRSAGTAGETERADATQVRVESTGAATSFQLSGHRWEVRRGVAGAVEGVRYDGQPATLAVLRYARAPATEAGSWSSGGLVFARLAGSPRAGVGPGPRVRVVGTGPADAIATPAPGDDVLVEGDVTVSGGEGGLAVRAVSTRGAFQGALLLLTPGSPARASLRAVDGKGSDAAIADPVALPGAGGHVRIAVRGAQIEVTVGGATLKGVLPAALAHGDVAVYAASPANVEATGLSIRRASGP